MRPSEPKRCLSTMPRVVLRAGWFALLGLALLLGGCGGDKPQTSAATSAAEKTPTPAGLKVFTDVNANEPKRLDPAFVKDLFEGFASSYVYDNLVLFGKGT